MVEDDKQRDEYTPIPYEESSKETKYISNDTDPEKQKGEKYLALEAEEEKTWWDNQTNRTIVAGLISIAFIALIAALVFLLPCTEDDTELTTSGPNATMFTEYMYEDEE